MTTFAQFLYINANPDKSHDFEDNEDFEQFRDNILLMPGMTLEKVDRDIDVPTKTKDNKLTPGTIFRRSHNLFRGLLKGETKISDLQRFLIAKLYEISLQLGDIKDNDLTLKWDEQLEPHLKRLTVDERYRCIMAMNTKLSTISGKDSKTFQTYLRGSKKEVVDVTEEVDEDSFKIPE